MHCLTFFFSFHMYKEYGFPGKKERCLILFLCFFILILQLQLNKKKKKKLKFLFREPHVNLFRFFCIKI